MPRCTDVLKILKSLAKGFTNCLGFGIITSLSLANAAGKYNQYAYGMRGWRNRQTRSFKGRVSNIVRVQVPSLAPEKETIPNRIVSFSMIFFLKYMVPSAASGSYIFFEIYGSERSEWFIYFFKKMIFADANDIATQ